MNQSFPLLPLRDIVVFPHMIVPLFVGRDRSVAALEAAMEADKEIFLVAQLDPGEDDPVRDDLYDTGVIATVLQLLKLPDGTVRVLVEGKQRAKLQSLDDDGKAVMATVEPIADAVDDSVDTAALMRSVVDQFESYAKLNKKMPAETAVQLSQIDDSSRLADSVAGNLNIKVADKQALLVENAPAKRLEMVFAFMEGELGVLQVEKKIRGRVKRQMEKSQREYYLNEQLKAIQRELGNDNGEGGDDLAELQAKIDSLKMSKEAKAKANAELKKLRAMAPMSAEATVVRNYLDTLIGLPWGKKSKLKKDIAKAQDVLDADHFALEKVKDRIVEYLAVQARTNKLKGPILCLVGPPGVGKTSLGRSIAKATGREFVRQSLGGVRDEAEIRGHRRTYIGSLPGKIVTNLKKAGTMNPLFLLDEIDKLGMDFRGDPSSALLEVLDPEQNHTFGDHYVEVDFDLSDVMFVATSNSMNIPPALLDRMEVIRLSGYTEDEKTNIALKYLLPKQLKNNGVKEGELKVEESAVRDIVRYYTREAGVRSLERELSKICRKVVKGLQLAQLKPQVVVTADNLNDYLGVRKFSYGRAEQQNQIGQVVGLAWTEVGGDLLTIEAATMPGKGNVQRTGQLGDVMKESVEAARTVVRSRARGLGIKDEVFEKRDIHIHVPDGATPKDGPSAGAAMTTAIVSALTGIPVRGEVAMTGEITLRGEVTAIGGLKEKLLAALRGGIKKVLIPEENVKDLQEIPANVKEHLEIIPVKWIDKVLELALERQPVPLTDEEVTPTPIPPEAPVAAKKRTGGTAVKH